jgi:hypothetical protein
MTDFETDFGYNTDRKFMKRIYAHILLSFFIMPVFAAKPLFMREVTVGGNSKAKLTTRLQFLHPGFMLRIPFAQQT